MTYSITYFCFPLWLRLNYLYKDEGVIHETS
jgi:hypothetical protein